MKKTDDQIDFNFSRPIDVQINLEVEFINFVLKEINYEKEKNLIFDKHLKFLILELFYCWLESNNQMLSVSMSKRGYLSNSRYNPNKISSYTIRVINFLKKENYIQFYPGFFDSIRKKSRLSRIKATNKLVNLFKNIKLPTKIKINHPSREYVIKTDGRKKIEYSDDFETQEVKEIIFNYNELISKTIIDIPLLEEQFINRHDNKKIIISKTASNANYMFQGTPFKKFKIEGCWWNRIDVEFLAIYAKFFIVNDSPTVFFDLSEKFNIFLKKKIGIENIFKKKDLEIFGRSQICYLIVKAVNSKNFESFFRSVLTEKKKYFKNEGLPTKEIKKRLQVFIENNQFISNYFFRSYRLNWDEYLMEVFYNLLKKCVPANIPVFLIKDKIYSSKTFSEIVKSNLDQILKLTLSEKKNEIGFTDCASYNFKSKGFFSRMFKSNNSSSRRYIERVKTYK